MCVLHAHTHVIIIDSMHAFHIQGYDDVGYSMELGINISSVRMKPKDKFIYVSINLFMQHDFPS